MLTLADLEEARQAVMGGLVLIVFLIGALLVGVAFLHLGSRGGDPGDGG